MNTARPDWIEEGVNAFAELNVAVPYQGVRTIRVPARIVAVIDKLACTIEFERDGNTVRRVVPRSRLHPAPA